MNARRARWTSPAALALLLGAGVPTPSGAQREAPAVVCGSWDLRHRDVATCVVFASSGALVSGGLEGDLSAWDPRTGAAIDAASLPSGASLRDAALLPGGALLVASGAGDLERVEPLDSHPPARTPLAADAGLLISASPDGARACATGRDGFARIVDAATGEVVHAIELADPGAGALELAAGPSAFVRGGDLVAVIGINRAKALRRAGTAEQPSSVLFVLDASTGERVLRIPLRTQVLVDVAIDSEREEIVAVDDAAAVRTWRLSGGEPRGVFRAVSGRPIAATALALVAPSDGSGGAWAAVAREDGAIVLVALADGAELARVPASSRAEVPAGALAIAPDGATLAATVGTQIALFELPSLAPLAPRFRHSGPVSAVAWSSDGARLATGSYDRGARVWRAADGAGLAAFDANAGFVHGVALGADADGEPLLFACGQDGSLRAFALGADREGARFTTLAHSAACTALAPSPDGATLASAGADGVVRLLDARTGAELASLDGIPGVQPHLAWFASGDRLAVGSADVRVIDVASRRVVRVLARPRAPILSLAVAPDGGTIAAGLASRAIALFDLAAGDAAAPALLQGHAGRVQAVAFSPDGALLASASSNETGARLWDTSTRAPLTTGGEPVLQGGLRGEVLALAFSPSGDRLAAGSMDGTAVIWPVTY